MRVDLDLVESQLHSTRNLPVHMWEAMLAELRLLRATGEAKSICLDAIAEALDVEVPYGELYGEVNELKSKLAAAEKAPRIASGYASATPKFSDKYPQEIYDYFVGAAKDDVEVVAKEGE